MEIHRSAANDSQREFEIKTNFLRKAIEEGADKKLPFGISEDVWVRRKNIVETLLGSSATATDLARQYGISRKRISQLFDKGMEGFWENSSEETQGSFSLKSLLGVKKPVSLPFRIKLSALNGGRSQNLYEDFRNGTITMDDVLAQTKGPLRNIRRTLRSWGVDIPKNTD